MLCDCYELGSDTSEDIYAREADEAGTIVEGHIKVTVGDRAQLLRLGDAYLFRRTASAILATSPES